MHIFREFEKIIPEKIFATFYVMLELISLFQMFEDVNVQGRVKSRKVIWISLEFTNFWAIWTLPIFTMIIVILHRLAVCFPIPSKKEVIGQEIKNLDKSIQRITKYWCYLKEKSVNLLV